MTASMSAATSKRKVPINFRSKTFWLFSLFALYSLFGWVFVPMIVESQLKQVLKSSANWETRIDNIIFNPYALSLELTGANIAAFVESAENTAESQDPVLSFERFYVNFNLLSSLGGTVSFDEIALEKPQVYLQLDASGTTNFQRAFATEADPAEAREETSDASNEPFALFFNLISISDGHLYFTDNAKEQSFQLTLAPLALSLENFSTHINEGGEYALSVALGDNQALNWRGQIGIAPFQSTGYLQLSQIDSSTFWHYAKDASPYWLNQAKVSVSGDYQITTQTEGLQFTIDNADLRLDDVVLSEHQQGEQWLAFKQLSVAPIAFDLQALSLDLGHIILDDPTLTISRAEDATLNILRPLDSVNTSTSNPAADQVEHNDVQDTPESPTESTSKFTWRIADFNLNKGTVHWSDQTLAKPAKLSIQALTLSVGALSEDLSQHFPFEIGFSLAGADATNSDQAAHSDQTTPVNTIKGSLSALPFSLAGTAELEDINLGLLQNYLAETANITLNDATLTVSAQYDLALQEQLTGTLDSSLQIDQLALTDSVFNQSLGGFQQLAIGPMAIRFPDEQNAQPVITIEAVTLDQAYGDVFITEDGRMNLSQLAKVQQDNTVNADQAAADPETPDEGNAVSESGAPDAPGIALLLDTLTLKQARFSYSDASLQPPFVTKISDLSGTITGLSTDKEARSRVALSGQIDTLGKLAVEGTLNPLSEQPYNDIRINVENIDMTSFSPYSGKYAGYQIDKGKLGLDLNYLIEGSKIKASNRVLLNQFQFGKTVESPDATSLPLPLAIAILKDLKGDIKVNMPVSGDLNDPSFSFGSVILNTFVNLITRAVTSPFSLLGNLVGGSDDISEVSFAANSSEISEEKQQAMLKLADALKQRPNLKLEIRAVADANIDRTPEKASTMAELMSLAKERAQQLSTFLTEQGQVSSSRVFTQEPVIIAAKPEQTEEEQQASATSVASKFTLGVR